MEIEENLGFSTWIDDDDIGPAFSEDVSRNCCFRVILCIETKIVKIEKKIIVCSNGEDEHHG